MADRSLWLWRLVAFALLVAGSAYWTWILEYRPEGYWAAVEDPAAWDGQEVTLSLFRVAEIEEGSYVLVKSDRSAPIEGPTSDLAVGQELYVRGRFRASDGVVVEEWREIAEGRPGKWKLAAAGLLFLAVAIPAWFTVRGGQVVERA